MNEDQHRNAVELLRPLRRTLGTILFAAMVASWFVWGVLALVLYLGGRFNSVLVMALGPFLLLLIPIAAIYLPVLIVRTVSRWSGLANRKWRRRALTAVTVFAFVGSLVLTCWCGGAPDDMWVRGIARHVKTHADIKGVQEWLSTLTADDLDPEGLRHTSNIVLERHFANSEQPAALAGLKVNWAEVRADDNGRLTVRLHLGGSGLMWHWGIVVGDRDMPIPPFDFSDFGEERFPLAPGAYIWRTE